MKKYNLIFTLDYEIHGNGDGSPYDLMIEPTYRLMDLLEKYKMKLTIMADVAELLCFKRYFDEFHEDKFHYKEIEKQLKEAIKRGHDVQLHIHSSYFNAKYKDQKWEQCMEEYNMAALSKERIDEMLKTSLTYLNNLLYPVSNNYKCIAFRAANWAMMPSYNIYNALVQNEIKIDTSVYKGGSQGGDVDYDYREAYSNIEAYRTSALDINKYDPEGLLTEYPIYTEMRYFWNFVTPMRLFRMLRAKLHKHKKENNELPKPTAKYDNRNLTFKSFLRESPWKFDFNQASGYQMIGALKRIIKLESIPDVVEIVLIGHSKSFVHYNEKTLEKFLKFVQKQKNVGSAVFKSDL